MKKVKSLRKHLVKLLEGGGAHVTFEDSIKGLPPDLRGKKPKGAEHSVWDLIEHLRIAQWDILEFSRNAKHVSPKWPDEYWPKPGTSPTDKAWTKSVGSIAADLKAMCKLVSAESTDLYAKIPHGDGQTILREALLIADHNAYHIGQIVLVRRLLGAWK